MVAPGGALLFPSIINLQGSARMEVPVRPAHSVYAQLRHIQGVPDPEGGVPVLRLRVLDNLIDRLLSHRERVAVPASRPAGEELDRMIQGLSRRLNAAVRSAPSPFGGMFPETGMLVDLVA